MRRIIFALALLCGSIGLAFADDKSEAQAEGLEKSPLDRLLPYTGAGGKLPGLEPEVPEQDERVERFRMGNQAESHLHGGTEELTQLEAVLEAYLTNNEKMGSGASKLMVIYDSFDSRVSGGQSGIVTHTLIKKFDEWAKLNPKSKFTQTLKAMALTNIAAKMGQRPFPADFESKLPSDPKALFKMARDVLEADTVGRVNNPAWHRVMLRVMSAQSEPMPAMMKILDEGTSRFPNIIDLYIGAVHGALHNSKNPSRDIAAIAHLASVRAASEGSAAFYAQIYHLVATKMGPSAVGQLFMDPSKFQAGVEQVTIRYPVQWNYQQFAWMACAIEDHEVAFQMFSQIQGRPLMRVWGQIEYFDHCRAWAEAKHSGAPTKKI
jgi:hypothetical protein